MNERFVWIIHFLMMSVLLPQLSLAEENRYGYRITTPGKTVIQIARDVYNDERQWKKIAYWNNLTAPYALSVGQILVLPMAPKVTVAAKNLVTGSEVPAPQYLPELPSVGRIIFDRNGYFVYEVNERAPSLSMVALENYGDKAMAKLIARWNGMPANSRLSLGQKLIFHEKPRLTVEQSNKVLTKEWARVGNTTMVQRISGGSYLPTESTPHAPASVAAPHPSVEKVQPVQQTQSIEITQPVHAEQNVQPAQSVQSSQPVQPAPPAQPSQPTATPSVPVPAVALPSVPSPGVAAPSLPSMPSIPSMPSSTPAAMKATSAPTEVVNEPVSENGFKKLPEKKVPSVVTEPTTLGQPLNKMETTEPTVFHPNEDPELQTNQQPVQQPEQQAVQAPVHQPTPQPLQQPVQQTEQQAVQQKAPAQQVAAPQPSVQPVVPTPPTVAPVQAPAPAAPVVPEQTAQTEENAERKPSSTDPLQQPEPTSDSYWLGSDTYRIMKTLSKPSGK